MWLATKYAAGKRNLPIAPMRQRQDQLGFDGAVHYRELNEAHPEVERGPDEDIEHHFSRLRAAERTMPKLAARAKLPSNALLVSQLGTSEDARRYRTLARDYPEVERGPDQALTDHYQALKKAFDKDNAEVGESEAGVVPQRGLTIEAPRTEVKLRDKPRAIRLVRPPEEIEAEQQPAPAAPSDLGGMPQRIPGWFTGDAMDQPPRDLIPGGGPLPERDPGRSFRWSPYDGPKPSYQPPQQSREDWVSGLADKGIYLNPDGSRMRPEDMVLPQRPLRGHDIWEQFTRPAGEPAYPGRHRAARALIAAYIKSLAGEV